MKRWRARAWSFARRCRPRDLIGRAQVVLPGLFMLLLVWIKSVTKVYDSPSVAYVCGQTLPWRYDESLPFNPAALVDDPLLECLRQPPECKTEHYYRDEGGIFAKFGLEGVRKERPCSCRDPSVSRTAQPADGVLGPDLAADRTRARARRIPAQPGSWVRSRGDGCGPSPPEPGGGCGALVCPGARALCRAGKGGCLGAVSCGR